MAYSYDFKDNVVYGADDINAIRASILTKGVVEETGESCKVEISDGTVKISKGQAIFADGCKIEVDEDGVEKEYVSGQVNYVYFYNNILAGVCEVIVTTIFPEGDYVMLAEINENGEVVDRREFAQLKTADAERYTASFKAEFETKDSIAANELIGEVTLPKNNCSLIEFFMNFGGEGLFHVMVFPKENNMVIWQYANGVFYSGDVMEIGSVGKSRGIRFIVSGNKMTVVKEYITETGTSTHQIKITGFCTR